MKLLTRKFIEIEDFRTMDKIFNYILDNFYLYSYIHPHKVIRLARTFDDSLTWMIIRHIQNY